MTLTPEQFNQLASREDLKELENRLKEELASKEDMNKVLNAIDTVIKEYQEVKEEQTSNQAAHDRMQGDIDTLKKHAGMPA